MSNEFIPDPEYSRLLIQNSQFHLRVRSGKVNYSSDEYRNMQKRLTEIEVKMSSNEIILHAQHLFPKVGTE